MYQFIHRGTLRILAERGREALAEHLHCRPEELKHDVIPPRRALSRERKGPAARPKGFTAVPEINVRAAAGPGAWNEALEKTKKLRADVTETANGTHARSRRADPSDKAAQPAV